MTRDDVEIIAQELLYQGFFRYERYRLRHKLHAGGWSAVMTREVFDRGRAVGVLLYDPKLDVVVLIQQFRIGAFAAGRGPWLTEIVAGALDPEEEPADAVRREAVEETGLAIEALLPMTTYLTTPGACSETIALFCGRVDAANAGGVHGIGHEDEDIRVIVVPAAVAFAMRRKNDEIQDSITVNALLWLELEREALRRRWA